MGERAEAIRRNAPALIWKAMLNPGEFFRVKPLAKFARMGDDELHNQARELCFNLWREALAKLHAGMRARKEDKTAAIKLFSEADRILERVDDIIANFGNATPGKRLADELETIQRDIGIRVLNARETTKGFDALTQPPLIRNKATMPNIERYRQLRGEIFAKSA